MNWEQLSAWELITRCVESPSSTAWQEFVRRFHHLFTCGAWRVARRWGSGSSEEVDDIIQEIYLKLCHDRGALLTSCRQHEDEAIFGFLKVVAANTALDYFRAKGARKRGSSVTIAMPEGQDPGSASAQVELERQLIVNRIEKVMLEETQGENGSRDRSIFRFYYRFGLTAKAIASLPQIDLTPKGVEGVVHRLTISIRKRLNLPQEEDSNRRLREAGRGESY